MYVLKMNKGEIRVTDIANSLGVSKASVNKAIKQLNEKIEILNKLREEKKYNYVISIDGGINDKTINKIKNVDFVISGSFICMNDDYQKQIDKLR